MSWLARLIPARSAPGAASVVGRGFVDSHLRWREACEDVRSAYRRWAKSEAAQRDRAFAGYRAALGREERAAHLHSHWTERARALER
jgi:hypothetical protein